MAKGLSFFLGANSGGGFSSRYDALLAHRFDELVILKGGPGCGKSSLMRTVAAAAEARGETVHRILCSGDPDSLDGVILEEENRAYVDGTAPHVIEPRYAAVHERYLDLSPYYDAAVKAERAEIVRAQDACSAAYASSYRVVGALAALRRERNARLRASFDLSKFLRRAEGIAARELRGKGYGGTAAGVFFDALSYRGALHLAPDAAEGYAHVYSLDDSALLAAPALELLKERAIAAGERVLVGYDVLQSDVPRHLFVPSRSLAFVTGGENAYRRVRLDAAAEGTLSRGEKAHLRLLRRLCRELEQEAVKALAAAKAAHDTLEALYHPYVDFAAVAALAEREAK